MYDSVDFQHLCYKGDNMQALTTQFKPVLQNTLPSVANAFKSAFPIVAATLAPAAITHIVNAQLGKMEWAKDRPVVSIGLKASTFVLATYAVTKVTNLGYPTVLAVQALCFATIFVVSKICASKTQQKAKVDGQTPGTESSNERSEAESQKEEKSQSREVVTQTEEWEKKRAELILSKKNFQDENDTLEANLETQSDE